MLVACCGSLPIHFPKKVFFQTSPDDLFGASVSPKPNMASAIFGCVAGKAVFCVGLCVENTALSAWKSDRDYSFTTFFITSPVSVNIFTK
jgi:hypothetical protein